MLGTRTSGAARLTNSIHDEKHTSGTEGSSSEEYQLHHVGIRSSDPVEIQVMVNGKQLKMEVDTGTALSIWKSNQKAHSGSDCE